MPKAFCTLDSLAYSAAISLTNDIDNTSKTPFGLLQMMDETIRKDYWILQSSCLSSYIKSIIYDSFQITSIDIDECSRRLTLSWQKGNNVWMKIGDTDSYSKCFLFLLKDEKKVTFDGIGEYNIIVTNMKILILPGSTLYSLLCTLLEEETIGNHEKLFVCELIIDYFYCQRYDGSDDIENLFGRHSHFEKMMINNKNYSKEKLKSALINKDIKLFSTKKYYHYY